MILEARGLWKRFGKNIALADVNLSLGRGLHLILGPNGSGKTTLLKLWLGLLKPSKGVVRTLGMDPWRQRPRLMSRVAAVLDELPPPWWQSGIEYLRLVATLRGVKWGEVVEVAEELGVTNYWERSIAAYSNGMRKRIMLLQGLIGDPEVVVLDEPYTSIDAATIKKLNTILERMVENGSTIVIATHVLPELRRVSTLTILNAGRLILHTDTRSAQGNLVAYRCRVDDVKLFINALLDMGVKEFKVEGDFVYVPAFVEPSKFSVKAECEKIIELGRAARMLLEAPVGEDI